MKKICYIVTLPITVKSFFIEQLKVLDEQGYNVTIICSWSRDLQDTLGNSIKYIPINIPRGISVVGSIKSIIKIFKIFKEEKFDLIQYSTPNAALYSAIAGFLSKTPIRNYHLMGLRFEGSKSFYRVVYKNLEKLTCKLSTHVECVSQSSLDSAISYKLFSPIKGTVVWNGSSGGVNLGRFNISNKERWKKEVRSSLCIKEHVLVYGFIGRITRDKGVNELLEAFYQVSSKYENVFLLFIGDFEKNHNINPDLLNWARKSHKVKFVEYVIEVEKYYSCLDVLILPSYREGFGNAVIEAEALGVPVIVSDISGPIDAMEDNVTGIVVKVRNIDSLINGIVKMLNNDFRKKCSKNSIIFVNENFESKKLCEKILLRKHELLIEMQKN